MSLVARCPACGGQIEWTLGDSLVVVCSYCRSAVARADRQLSDLGKVADLADTGTVLRLGMKGTWKSVHFTLVGHGQLAHPAGGTWDEWYAAFSDGRWGWLAEAQGQLYLTFRGSFPDLPVYASLRVGEPLNADFVVAEKSQARALGVEGELPFAWRPGAEYDFVDLSGPSGVTATIDYSEDPPLFFVGRTVTLDELGIAAGTRVQKGEATSIKALELNCPNCHGPLPLRAPDQSLRVTCPSCDGLLDVQAGKLSYLRALDKLDEEPTLVLGRVGTLGDTKYTVLGFLRRGVTVDGTLYAWSEYLLHAPRIGFRWLVEANGHWMFVEPLAAGEAGSLDETRKTFRKETFSIFQRGLATVLHVRGEFYWRVEAGETVESTDWIAPPHMVSAERSDDEVNWSLGSHLPAAEVTRAFGVTTLPPAVGVGATQPFAHRDVVRWWPVLMALAVAVWLVVLGSRNERELFTQSFTLDPAVAPAEQNPAEPAEAGEKVNTQVFFSGPLELAAHQSLEVQLDSSIDNNWLAVDGDLIAEDSGEVHAFGIPLEHYSGVEDGESWSEGSASASVYLPSVKAGRYTVRLEFQWPKAVQSPYARVRISQGAVNHLFLWLTLGAISLPAILCWLWMRAFEARRWRDADFTPQGNLNTGSSDGDDD